MEPKKTELEHHEPLISRDEACELLKISRVTIWRYTKEGKLPYFRVGRKLLFKRSVLLAAIEVSKIN